MCGHQGPGCSRYCTGTGQVPVHRLPALCHPGSCSCSEVRQSLQTSLCTDQVPHPLTGKPWRRIWWCGVSPPHPFTPGSRPLPSLTWQLLPHRPGDPHPSWCGSPGEEMCLKCKGEGPILPSHSTSGCVYGVCVCTSVECVCVCNVFRVCCESVCVCV